VWINLFASLCLLSVSSYWVSLLLATFVSRSPLGFEPLVFISSVLIAGAALWVWMTQPILQAIEHPTPSIKPARGILQDELQPAKNDLPWILGITAILFIVLAWVKGVAFSADGNWFLFNYLQLNDANPVYYAMLLYWAPLSSLVYGLTFDLGGLPLLTLLQGGLALSSACALFLLARPWGRRFAWTVVVFWWFYWQLQLYYHLIGGDAMMVCLVPLWLYALRLAVQHQKWEFWLAVGILVGLHALTRAGNLLMLASFVGILFVGKSPRLCTKHFAVAGLGLILVLLPHILNMGLRYDYWGLSRGSNTLWWAAVYIPHSIVEVDNGEATRRFGTLLEDNLLNTDLYEGVTLETFFSTPSYRTYDDAISVLDRTEGWDSEYALLRPVAWEAIRAHPAAFLRDTVRDFVRLMGIKEPLVGTKSDDVEQVREPIFLTTGTYQHFLTNHPSGQPPDPERVAAIQAQFADFIEPIRQQSTRPIFDTLNELWLRLGIVAAWWFVALPLAFWWLDDVGRKWLFAAGLGILAVVVPAALSNPEPRYRVPFDPLMLFALAVCMLNASRLLRKAVYSGSSVK
jgi:hypothetical protein